MSKKVTERFRLIVHLLLLCSITMGILFFVNEILMEENKWNRNYLLISVFFLICILLYCILFYKRLLNTSMKSLLLIAFFLISALMLFLTDDYINVPLWIIGGILAASLSDCSLGILYLYFFAFQAIYLQDVWLFGLLFHFLAATGVCLMIRKMKTWLSMLYIMIFAGSLVMILSLLLNRFHNHRQALLDAFPILLIYLGCIFIVKLIQSVMELGAEKNKYQYLEQLALETTPETAKEPDYSVFCDETAELLQELKAKHKSTYMHSKLVAKFAKEAAELLGLRADLVQAAAFYHEIGKLRGGIVAEQTIIIGNEHHFPKELLELLSVFEKGENKSLNTREMVVLYATDTILTLYLHLRRTGSLVTVSKIVDNAISNHLLKGQWNATGLTITECTLLRDFYIERLEEQDRKRNK